MRRFWEDVRTTLVEKVTEWSWNLRPSKVRMEEEHVEGSEDFQWRCRNKEMERNRRKVRVQEVGKRLVIWDFSVGHAPNVTNLDPCVFFCIDSEEEGSEKGEVNGVPGHREASPELFLSSPMCNECEFFELDSAEGKCFSSVSVFVYPCDGFLWFCLVCGGVLWAGRRQ